MPLAPSTGYTGPLGPYYFLVLYNVICTVRSLIHMCFKDGGGPTIAGFPPITNDAVGKNMVAIFGQWGVSQLVFSVIIWGVVLYYPEHTTAMLMICELELVLRQVMGLWKRVYTSRTPPGAIGTRVMIPVMFVMCLWSYYG